MHIHNNRLVFEEDDGRLHVAKNAHSLIVFHEHTGKLIAAFPVHRKFDAIVAHSGARLTVTGALTVIAAGQSAVWAEADTKVWALSGSIIFAGNGSVVLADHHSRVHGLSGSKVIGKPFATVHAGAGCQASVSRKTRLDSYEGARISYTD